MKRVSLSKAFAVILALCACVPSLVHAADPVEVVAQKICKSGPAGLNDQTLFKADLREKVANILAGFEKAFGKCQKASSRGKNRVEYVYKKARVPGKLYVNEAGKITGIWFDGAVRTDDTPEEALKDFGKLPGKVAISIRFEGDKNLHALNHDVPLAVGSSFKLSILASLKSKVESGKLRWDVVVALPAHAVSLPSGILQNWPSNSPLTLHSLATLMISISDNTATDTLLFHLGRREVEKFSHARNRPFLSTLEMFQLKSEKGKPFADRYLKADEKARRQILSELSRLGNDGLVLSGLPAHVEKIEWFYTTDELCDLIFDLKDLELLSVNPGVADKKDFIRVVYKGGSEAGVLNMTHGLQNRQSGKWVCVSATWNNAKEKLDQKQFTSLLKRLFYLLAK